MKKYYGFFDILQKNYPENIKECPLYYKEAADLYDQIQVTYDDYEMFLEQAFLYGGPILELCCGSGRLTLPLAKAGFQITAVDLSEDMLANLQEQLKKKYRRAQANLTCVKADMTKLSLDKKYNLIMIGATSIRLMEADFTVFFNQMYELLNDGGCFYFNFEDMPILNQLNIVEEPLLAGAYEDKEGKLSIVNVQRTVSYAEKRATVNLLSYKPGTDEKMLLSHTDYRIFGTEDIKQAAKKSLFGNCELIPIMNQNYFCKMEKK